MNNEAKWYVIHTYSGYEKLVAENIKKYIEKKNIGDIIQEAKVPTQKIQELRNGKYCEVERKLFPGYVIVKMVLDEESWLIIKRIKGVTGFVGDAHNPKSLTPEEVEKLGIEKKVIKVDYVVGDIVSVISGAFEGTEGEVKEIDMDNKKVKIGISIFGRNTIVEVDLDKVILKK